MRGVRRKKRAAEEAENSSAKARVEEARKKSLRETEREIEDIGDVAGLPLAHIRDANGRLDGSRLSPDEAWPETMVYAKELPSEIEIAEIEYRNASAGLAIDLDGHYRWNEHLDDFDFYTDLATDGIEASMQGLRAVVHQDLVPGTHRFFYPEYCDPSLLIIDKHNVVVATIWNFNGYHNELDDHLSLLVQCLGGATAPVYIGGIKMIKMNASTFTVKLKLMLNKEYANLFCLDALLEHGPEDSIISSKPKSNSIERNEEEEAVLMDARRGDLSRSVLQKAKQMSSAEKNAPPTFRLKRRNRGPMNGDAIPALLYNLAKRAKKKNQGVFSVTGIDFGPDCDPATLNNFLLGPKQRSEIFHGLSDSDDNEKSDILLENHVFEQLRRRASSSSNHRRSTQDWSVTTLLDMASIDDSEEDFTVSMDESERALYAKLKSSLHPFQRRGVAFMRSRENATNSLTLHPAWSQYILKASGRCIYAHKWFKCISRFFFPAPLAATCGGMLCDDVGLGKTLQVLGHVLSSPPPPGWAVNELPLVTDEPIPVKSTLVVCPAALLDQWENEIEKHVKPGGLKYCVYLGVKGNGGASTEAEEIMNAPRPQRKRSRPKRHGFDQEEDDSRSEREDRPQIPSGPVEVLARLSQFFSGPRRTAPDPVANCDLILCSFETLRDDVRKTNAVQSADEMAWLSTPLGALGFWRLILDEAQLVAQTNSMAAIMCSSLVRRHAWICTATPVTRDIAELRGLLAFLAVEPFAQHGDQLLIDNFRCRSAGSRACLLSLLKGLMLRRGQRMPGIQKQIALPACTWDQVNLSATPAERAAYKIAMDALSRSYTAFARHQQRVGVSSSSRIGGRYLGALNGDLTRLRQTICHPAVVNQRRDAAKNNDSVIGNATVLPMSTVLKRIVARAEREALQAQLTALRAEFIHCIAAVSIAETHDETLDSICARFEQLRTAFSAKLYDSAPSDQDNAAKSQDEKGELEHARKCEESFDRLGAEIAMFKERHPRGTMDYDNEIIMTAGGGGTLSLYWQQQQESEQALPVVDINDDSDDDDENLGRNTRGRRGVWLGGDATRDKMAERVARLVVKHGPTKAVSAAKKDVATAAATCREKDSMRNYLLRELKESEDKKNEAVSASRTDEVDDDVPQNDPNSCPICLEARGVDTRWSMTKCGHAGCGDCFARWIGSNKTCPLCKKPMTLPMLFIVTDDEDEEKKKEKDSKASMGAAQAAQEGDWGSKLSAFLQEAGKASRIGEKVVVFSAWTRLLKLAGDACAAHDILCASLIGSPTAKRMALTEFRQAATVLLVPLFGGASGAGGGGAAGLTLTHASTAIILEPALQPGIEEQAAGRISRIGQTKPTRVIRLIVNDTIEPKILEWQQRRMNDNGHDRASGGGLSLNDFVQLGIATSS